MNTTALPAAGAILALLPQLLVPTPARAANYAAQVVQFHPGTGATPGYDHTDALLGEPSRVTPGEFGGPVDPFSSPWQSGQLLSLGAGGSVTLRFDHPVLDQPGNPFGLDFLVFSSAAFLIVNGDFSGGGITDGSLFGAASGPTRVAVSQDGLRFFTLDPDLAPTVDGFFPTDGSGDFSRPVDPRLDAADFAGLGLEGIRGLYAGSGGGTGYDLDWARNADGQPVALDSILFVRIDVISDRAEIDAVSAVPEPSSFALLLAGGFLLRLRTSRSRRMAAR